MSFENTNQKLMPGGYYHIYNRGNNKEVIFKSSENYYYFLRLWKKHIEPVAQTFCYNLLPNHFHFFIRIRDVSQVRNTCEASGILGTSQVMGACEVSDLKPCEASRAFANLFNAYAKAINKSYNRSGSLFQERFRRKEITTEAYYTAIIGYIINNAVKHGLCNNAEDYPYSAYHSLLSDKPTALLRNEVIQWFGNKAVFAAYISNHQNRLLNLREILEHENDDANSPV